MASVFFMKPLLRALSGGKIFKFFYGWLFRILSGIVVLCGITAIIAFIASVVKASNLHLMVGGLLFSLFFLVSIYMIMHTLLIRADEILSIPESGFVITTLVSVLIRTMGEVLFCILLPTGFGVSFLVLISGNRIRQIFPMIPSYLNQFNLFQFTLIFILMIFTSFIVSVLVLGFFYLVAETFIATILTARHSRVIRKIAEKYHEKNLE